MIKELSSEEFQSALRAVMEKAEKELAAVNAAELSVDTEAATGACCTYTVGFSSCTGGITQNACASIARKYNLSYKWTAGKQCSQVSCP